MFKLINGDCLEVMRELANDGIKVDLVLTDPPYGTTACKWDNIIPFDEMWECLDNITNPNTPIALFGSEPFSSYLRLSNIQNYRYDWIWHKNYSGGFVNAKKMPMKYHENISIFYRKLPCYNPQFQEYSESTKKRFKEGETHKGKSPNRIHEGLVPKHHSISFKRGKYPESVQYFKGVNTANNARLHPTQKPVALLEYLIKTYTNKSDTVLDFTMGSGSTGVACLETNRQFIGIELDKDYYQIAQERCKNYQTKLEV